MLVKGKTISRPAVPSGPAVTVALSVLPTTYDVNSYASSGFQTEVAALTQPSVYLVDPLGHLALDTDVVQKVALRTDPQQVEYHINPKATWSDGVPLSCQDFYLAWLAGASHAEKAGSTDHTPAFATYAAVDYARLKAPRCSDGGRTVTVSFHQPVSGWQTLFEGLLPAHIAAKDAGISDITTITDTDTSGPVQALAKAYNADFGTLGPDKNPSAGPYLITSASDKTIVLGRNPTWWGNPAGPEEVRLVAQPDDSAAVRSVRRGEADAASLTDQDLSMADSLRSLGSTTRTNQVAPVADHVEINKHSAVFGGDAGSALRQAMFNCIDRTAIVTSVVHRLDPKAHPLGNLLVSPWDPAYTDHYQDFLTPNLPRAKTLMQQGGWTLGKDGIYARGKAKAAFTLGVLPNDTRTAVAALVKKQCREAGIDITVAHLDVSTLLAGKYQAALFGWAESIAPAGYADLYQSKGSSNTMGYSNKEVDSLFAKIKAEVRPTDESARLNQIDKVIADSHVALPLYDQVAINLQSKQIHTTVTNDYFWGGPVWDAYAWTVAP